MEDRGADLTNSLGSHSEDQPLLSKSKSTPRRFDYSTTGVGGGQPDRKYGDLPISPDIIAPRRDMIRMPCRRNTSASLDVMRRRDPPFDVPIQASSSRQLRALQEAVTTYANTHFSDDWAGYWSSLNYLLVLVPIGIIGGVFEWPDTIVFGANFVGMVPLATILGKSTEDIAHHTNETIGALFNVTFGNAIELIISISALRAHRFVLIQNTLVGSILSNLLLVLGSSFIAGGLIYSEQVMLPAVSEANADLLAFAVFGISIPALFSLAVNGVENKPALEERMSLWTAVGLLVIYGLYLYFQLVTHKELYEKNDDGEELGDVTERSLGDSTDIESLAGSIQHVMATRRPTNLRNNMDTSTYHPASPGRNLELFPNAIMEDEDDEPVAPLPVAVAILVSCVLIVSVSSEYLIASIDGFSQSAGLSQSLISVVLLPLIGNAVEHLSAVLVARRNKIDLAISIACGSSVQIALFVAPVMVLISWLFPGEKLTLNFDIFHTASLAFSVFVVNATLADTRTNWLEGALLVACYAILCVAFALM